MGQVRESRLSPDVLFGVAFVLFGLWAIAGGLFWRNAPTVVLGAAALVYGFRRTPLPSVGDSTAGRPAPGDD